MIVSCPSSVSLTFRVAVLFFSPLYLLFGLKLKTIVSVKSASAEAVIEERTHGTCTRLKAELEVELGYDSEKRLQL